MNHIDDFKQWLKEHWIFCEEPEAVYKHLALSPLEWNYVARIINLVRAQLPEDSIYLGIADDTKTYIRLTVETDDLERAYVLTKDLIGNKVDHFFDVDTWVLYI